MYLYEKAITKDLNKLFTNSKVTAVIADTLDEGLRRIASQKEDQITLPAIVIVGGDWQLSEQNFYSTMHGSEVRRNKYSSDDSVGADFIKEVNVLAFTPEYNIYILAYSSRECDMLTREILFHYYTNPTLIVDIPYGLDITHTFNLVFGHNIRKSQRPGLVYRTIPLTISGAYLWHNNTFGVVKETDITIKEEYDETIRQESLL